ncbi:hypothetical protein HDV00_002418 [Rhizophlyctis rosea]|nr:hypothetical protein HDV00_002418 [Rhizophlyctis rosea]
MAAVVTVVKKKRRSLLENRADGIVDTILSGLQESQAEDFLEIALEIDSLLKAFETSAPGPTIAGWHCVGFDGEYDGEPEHEKEERKARQIHEAVIVEQISKGLVSRKSAVRAASFSAAVALVRGRGVAVSERLYEAVGGEDGETRVFTVERRTKEECLESVQLYHIDYE